MGLVIPSQAMKKCELGHLLKRAAFLRALCCNQGFLLSFQGVLYDLDKVGHPGVRLKGETLHFEQISVRRPLGDSKLPDKEWCSCVGKENPFFVLSVPWRERMNIRTCRVKGRSARGKEAPGCVFARLSESLELEVKGPHHVAFNSSCHFHQRWDFPDWKMLQLFCGTKIYILSTIYSIYIYSRK